MAEITIKSVEGNPLNINVVMTAVEHSMLNGEIVTETVDFYPDTSKPVRAYLDCTTARKQFCPTTYVDGNIVYLSCDNATAGVYTLTVTCTDTNGKARRYKSDACIEVYDLTSAAEIAGSFDEQTYEMNGVFYTSMVQSDWDEVNPASPAYILNKPDLTEYATKEDIETIEGEIPVIPEWAQQPQKPSYTAGEVGAVPTSRTVNGKALSEDITLNAQDVGAQTPIADLAQIREGAAKGATAYQKPSTGIAKSDLTNGIQQSLDRADTALQAAALTPLQNQIDTINNKIPTDATSTNELADKNYVERLVNEKQDTINDLDAIRRGAAKGATAYQLPSNGIPKTDLAVGVQQSLDKANTAYQKPSAGIPKTDLAQAVQTTLSNADTDHTNVATLQEKVSTIEGKIPSAASASNQLVDEESLSEHYAKKDGAYEEMLAGSALNLVDTSGSPVLREFTYDTAGGSDDIGTGSALIKRMRGNTIVWNQLAKALNNNDWGSTGTLTVTYTNHVARATTNIDNAESWQNRFLQREYTNNIQGHKLLVAATVTPSVSCNVSVWTYGKDAEGITSGYSSYYRYENLSANVKKRVSAIFDMSQKAAVISCYPAVSFYGNALPANSYMDIQDFVFFDLTKMFGAGNEPSTVEEFEALFPLDYYDYNEGQLLSFNGNSIKTVGFNQLNIHGRTTEYTKFTRPTDNASPFLNENIVIKGISGSGYIYTGTVSDYTIVGNTITIKTTDLSYSAPYGIGFPVKVFPNTIYCIRAVKGTIGVISLSFYTDDSYITYSNVRDANNMKNGVTLVTPSNARWVIIAFNPDSRNGTSTFSDICFNLSWSGTKNGTYEPYQEHVHDISFYKTIKDGDGNVLFPNGLLSAGSVYDEVTATKAIRRIGVVDLGTLTWTYNAESNHERFATYGLQNLIKGVPLNQVGNLISSVLKATTSNDTYLHSEDYSMSLTLNGLLFVYCSAYTTAATFKAAMSGVMLYYELAEPIEVDFEEQNMAYQVNDWGTEQLLPENTSTPTTTPAMLDVTYGINAVDTIKNLPRNYLAQDDLDRLLSAMGSALGFTYTKTWNEADKQWAFTVTKTATTNDENV